MMFCLQLKQNAKVLDWLVSHLRGESPKDLELSNVDVRRDEGIKCRSHIRCAALRCAFFPCWVQLVATRASCSCAASRCAALRFYELRCAALFFMLVQLVATICSCAALRCSALRFNKLLRAALRCAASY